MHEQPWHLAFRAENGAREAKAFEGILDPEPCRPEGAQRLAFPGAEGKLRAPLLALIIDDGDARAGGVGCGQPPEALSFVEQCDCAVVCALQSNGLVADH